MGGVFGHMSHIYDNPYMTFGQIKEIMQAASAGELQGTEKTDGQNLFVSYNVQDGTVRAARNKGNIKAGGMTPAELLAKFEGRGALTDAFVNSFYAFEEAVESLSDEEQLELFGPDTNIYYNAEVMDPGSANVINYDKKTFLIHRAGHAAYDRETGKPIPDKSGKDFGEEQAAKLQAALERTQDKMSKRDFKVEVNAIRNLEGLGNDEDLMIALGRLDQFMSEVGVGDNDSIGTYIVKSLDKLISEQIPELNRDAKKLLIKRIMEDYYGVIEGEAGPKKVRGLETRQILKVADDPEVNDRVKHLASNYPLYLKKIIFPIEDIIHDFAVEMLRSLRSAFVLDSDEELERQRAEVDKAIKAIEASGNEEAMEILKVQMEKLKNIEGVSSAAEGFVFDYDGNTYKFTGGFAPMNQILGLFKYGRKGIPALAEKKQRRGCTKLPTGLMGTVDFTISEGVGSWAIKQGIERAASVAGVSADESGLDSELSKIQGTLNVLDEESSETVLYLPGGFKPPHKGHFALVRDALEKNPGAKLVIMSGESHRDGVSLAQSKKVWDIYFNAIGKSDQVEVRELKNEPQYDEGGNVLQKPMRGAGVKEPVGGWPEDIDPRRRSIPKAKIVRDEDGQPVMLDISTKSPINSIANAIRFTDKPTSSKIVASGADPGNANEISNYLKGLGLDVETEIVPVRVKSGDTKMSATDMRRSIGQGMESFSQYLPDELSDEEAQEVFTILGGGLEEMSGAGAVAGYSLPLGASPRRPATYGSEKKTRKKDEFLKEEMVSEVMNYLLGISVG